MFEIWIHPRHKPESAVKVWPSGAAVPEGFVAESGEYVFEARGPGASDLDFSIDDQQLIALRSQMSDTARWLWEPGFYSGIIEFSLTRGSRKIVAGEMELDPNLAKLTRGEFDQMVREILADTFALFTLSSARKSVAKGAGGETPPIARLEFLRSRVSDIATAVERINSQPVRTLTSKMFRVASGKPVRISASDLAKSYRSDRLMRLPACSPLRSRLGEFFPQALWITRRQAMLDIGEHRAIKAELMNWAAWLSAVGRKLDQVPQGQEDQQAMRIRRSWVIRCRQMSKRLRDLVQLPVFRDVAGGRQPLTLTAVFRWAGPYRKFFQLSRDFRLGLAKITGEFLNMPIARTFDLYELWVFLRLARAGVALFGAKAIDASSLFRESHRDGRIELAASSVGIKLSPNVVLAFQRSYQEYWLVKPPAAAPGSFSRTMTPDVTLETTAAGKPGIDVVVLDAKYRMDQQLSDAVVTLHTYRDAIVQEMSPGKPPESVVRGAYLVTPQIPRAEIANSTKEWQSYRVPGLLFHPVYRSTFRFGAVSLRPGMTDAEVVEVLKRVLLDAKVPWTPAAP